MKQSIKHKNIIQAIKRKFKRNYYSQKILEHKNKYKNIYYEGGNRRTYKSGSPLLAKLAINKNDMTGKTDIANVFNRFFTNIDPESAKKSQLRPEHFRAFYIN